MARGYFQLTVWWILPSVPTVTLGQISKTKKIPNSNKNANIAATKEFWYKRLYIIIYNHSKKSIRLAWCMERSHPKLFKDHRIYRCDRRS